MSTTVLEQRPPKRTLGYHLGTVALWTGFLSFLGIFLVILVPTC